MIGQSISAAFFHHFINLICQKTLLFFAFFFIFLHFPLIPDAFASKKLQRKNTSVTRKDLKFNIFKLKYYNTLIGSDLLWNV